MSKAKTIAKTCVNPLTGRSIRVGGAAHRQLVAENVLKSTKKTSSKATKATKKVSTRKAGGTAATAATEKKKAGLFGMCVSTRVTRFNFARKIRNLANDYATDPCITKNEVQGGLAIVAELNALALKVSNLPISTSSSKGGKAKAIVAQPKAKAEITKTETSKTGGAKRRKGLTAKQALVQRAQLAHARKPLKVSRSKTAKARKHARKAKHPVLSPVGQKTGKISKSSRDGKYYFVNKKGAGKHKHWKLVPGNPTSRHQAKAKLSKYMKTHA